MSLRRSFTALFLLFSLLTAAAVFIHTPLEGTGQAEGLSQASQGFPWLSGFTTAALGVSAAILTLAITLVALRRPVRDDDDRPVTRRILPPVTIILVILFLAAGLLHWDHYQHHLERESRESTRRVMQDFAASMRSTEHSMLLLLKAAATTAATQRAIIQRNSNYLIDRWGPLLAAMQTTDASRHFTVTDAEGRVIVRLHQPENSGDRLQRDVFEQAYTSESIYSGLEVKADGSAYLTSVVPVFAGNDLIGYLVLCAELQYLLDDIHNRTRTHIGIVLHKSILQRESWQSANPDGQWDRLPDSVIAYYSGGPLPAQFDGVANHHPEHGHSHDYLGQVIPSEKAHWRIAAQALHDHRERDVGCILIVKDVSSDVADFRRTAILAGLSGTSFFFALLLFLSAILRRTDQRLAAQQKNIAQSEGQLRDILEHAPVGIIVANVETGRFILTNAIISRMLGYSAEELANMQPQELHPVEEHPHVLAGFQRIVRERTPFLDTFQMLRKDGSTFPAEIQTGALEMAGKDCVMGIFIDISARVAAKKAEQEREAQFRTLFHESPIPTYLMDPEDGSIVDANPAAYESLGLNSLEELCQTNFWIDPPYSHTDAILKMKEAQLCGRLTYNWQSRKKDGSLIKEEIHLRPMRFQGKDCILALTVDVTEREDDRENLVALNQKLETAVIRANELSLAAQSATVAKSEFINNLSHELRTPMNAIVGLLELLEDEPLSNNVRDYLDMMRESSESMTNMVNQLIIFADLETTRTDVVPEPLKLRGLIKTKAANLRVQAQRKGLVFRFRVLPGTPETLLTDPLHLRRILLNLGKNAIEFSDKGRVSLRVLSDPERPAFVRFEFIDSGPGIRPEHEPHLFSPFWQADGSLTRKHEGIGLGLPVSKLLVEALGGEIGYHNRPEGGAVFWFSIPAKWGAEKDTTTPAPREILIVEDDEASAMVCQHIIDPEGIRSIVAKDAQEALEQLQSHSFRLILLDIQLPGKDGLTLLQEIRNSSGWATPDDVPVVVVTAFAFTADRDRCFRAGANDYISKPVNPTQLREATNRWLKKSESARD